MTPSSQEQSAAVRMLNELFQEGSEKGLWEPGNKTEFSRAISMERTRVIRLLRGERPDDEVESVATNVRRIIETGATAERANEENIFEGVDGIEAAVTEFDRYYLLGVREGKWNTMSECAVVLGMSRGTVRKFRETPVEDFQGSTREKAFYGRMLTKVKKVLSHPKKAKRAGQKPDDVQAESAPMLPLQAPVLSEAPAGDLATLISGPAIARIDNLQRQLPEIIAAELAKLKTPEAPAAPEGIIPSQWADEIVGGRMEISNQRKKGMRFIVTKDTFRKLLAAPLSGEEITDTSLLAQTSANADTELRRRLEALHQMPESAERAEAIRALIPAISERIREAVALAITLEKVREVEIESGLLRAMRHFDSVSNIFNS